MLLNCFEYLTNSLFLMSSICLISDDCIDSNRLLTASSFFLMAAAISLAIRYVSRFKRLRSTLSPSSYLMVSRNALRSFISSGMRLSMSLSCLARVLSSLNSGLLIRYSEIRPIAARWLARPLHWSASARDLPSEMRNFSDLSIISCKLALRLCIFKISFTRSYVNVG